METVGDRIRKRRKDLNLTQGQLGKDSGLGTATISGLELGTQHGTTKMHKIAEVLRVSITWLETGDHAPADVRQIREEPQTYRAHGVNVTPDGARVGAEWDKIEGDEYKKLAREFIEGLVAAQVRATRRLPGISASRSKAGKSKGRRADLE